MIEKSRNNTQKINPENRLTKISKEEFISVIKLITPGTNLRAALNGAQKIGNGALIVIENEEVLNLIDGGFKIDTPFTAQKLIELTKMDGAIVISKDLKKINYANVLLTPDSEIKTNETGTRHKAAERTAKQAKTIAVAISERKKEVTLYYKNLRHPIINTEYLLRKTNERLQLLEKQRELFDNLSKRLTKMDLKSYFNLNQAIPVVQKGKLIQKSTSDLRKYSSELGREGTLLKIRLKEIITGIEKEIELVLKDYAKDPIFARNMLEKLTYDEILNENKICKILGYEKPNINKESVQGWHLLMKTSISENEAKRLIECIGSWKKISTSNGEKLKEILGEEKAMAFKDDLKKINISYNLK